VKQASPATALTIAVAKIVPLILLLGALVVVATAVGLFICRRHPEWRRSTKQLIMTAMMVAAALAWGLVLVARAN
jgi:hypothetical protein